MTTTNNTILPTGTTTQEEERSRPGYKKTKLGWIPEEWEVMELADVAKINPPKPILEDEVQISFIGMADVSENAEIKNNKAKKYKEVKKGFTSFKNQDIIIAKITPCFENYKGALARGLINCYGFGSTEFHILRPAELVENRFLFYHTLTHRFRKLGEANMTGSAGQKRVPKSFIRRYKIPLPPLSEQRQIAEILSTWDRAIEKTEQLIAAKERRKKGLMQQLLTGKVRFEGFEEEWVYGNLKEVAKTFSGGTPPTHVPEFYKGQIPLLRSTEVNKRYINNVEAFISEKALKKSSAKMVKPNTILVAMYGATGGVVGLTKIKAAINQAILALMPNEKIDNSFFFHYLEREMPLIAEKASQGGQPNLNSTLIKDAKIKFPSSMKEQQKIASVLNACDREIEQLKDKLEKLKEQKRGLMQGLLSGEFRLVRNNKTLN